MRNARRGGWVGVRDAAVPETSRGEPASFARRGPSREGTGTLSGFPFLRSPRARVDGSETDLEGGADAVLGGARPRRDGGRAGLHVRRRRVRVIDLQLDA